jgi:hypothetical protein
MDSWAPTLRNNHTNSCRANVRAVATVCRDKNQQPADISVAGRARGGRAMRTKRSLPVVRSARVTDAMPTLPITLARGDRLVWDGANVRAAKLFAKDRARVDQFAALWGDSRMQKVSELTLTFKTRRGARAIARLAGALPPTVRSLRLGDPEAQYAEDVGGVRLLEIAALLIPQLTGLESLTLHGPLYDVGRKSDARGGVDVLLAPLLDGAARTLIHTHLRELVLGELGMAAAALMTLRAESLPALRRLVIAPRYPQMESIDSLCLGLAPGGLLRQLDELTLAGTCTGAGVELLAAALGDHRIPRLELRTSTIASDVCTRFAAFCDELVCSDGAARVAAEEWFEHANKPEWGRGRVIRRLDDKVEIAFAGAGTKVLVASSPFLRRVTAESKP